MSAEGYKYDKEEWKKRKNVTEEECKDDKNAKSGEFMTEGHIGRNKVKIQYM
jgi:hypothetical protein